MENTRMQRLILGVILIFFCISAGCDQKEPTVQVDLSKKEQVSLKKEAGVITYAYLPQYSHRVSYQRHHLLVEYLREETGLNIKQIFPNTFDQHMQMVGQGKIDISFSNPLIYIKIAHRYGARAFARIAEIYSQEKFRGQIICRTDNRLIRTIADCRGKSWIAVDSTSAGGYLYPLAYFFANGIRQKDFSEVTFAPGPGGKQEKVVLSVYAGKYDVGTIREGTLNVVADKIDVNEIRVIATTPPAPGWVYAAKADLEPQIIKKIRTALLKLDPHNPIHKRILQTADFVSIVSSVDRDFDPVRELAQRVGIGLEEGRRVQ